MSELTCRLPSPLTLGACPVPPRCLGATFRFGPAYRPGLEEPVSQLPLCCLRLSRGWALFDQERRGVGPGLAAGKPLPAPGVLGHSLCLRWGLGWGQQCTGSWTGGGGSLCPSFPPLGPFFLSQLVLGLALEPRFFPCHPLPGQRLRLPAPDICPALTPFLSSASLLHLDSEC